MKRNSNKLIILLLSIVSFPFITHAFYTFPTKIDTKVERMNIQTVLNTVMIPSPNLKVDGVLGRKSIQAIQAFQESHGLVADGKVGPITRNTLETAQTGNTAYTPTTTGCLSGAIYNTQTGQLCNTTTYTNGCNGTNKYNTITGALCSNTTNTGGGGGTVYTVPTCTGSTTQSCTITNGTGTQSRTCNSGNWSNYGSCTLSSCNTGYSINGNTCIVTTSTTPVCTGSTTQSCTITNGTGTQSRTCTNGVWSAYNSCTLSSCNTGYSISNNTCILTPTPDTTKPVINTFTFPTTSTSLNVPFTLSATDNTGVTGYFLSESSTTPNTSSGLPIGV